MAKFSCWWGFLLLSGRVDEKVVDLSADFRLADVEVYKKVRLARLDPIREALIPCMFIMRGC